MNKDSIQWYGNEETREGIEELRESEINSVFDRESTMKTIAMEKVSRKEKNTKN